MKKIRYRIQRALRPTRLERRGFLLTVANNSKNLVVVALQASLSKARALPILFLDSSLRGRALGQKILLALSTNLKLNNR